MIGDAIGGWKMESLWPTKALVFLFQGFLW